MKVKNESKEVKRNKFKNLQKISSAWKNKTFEEYLEYYKNYYDKYEFKFENNSYFLNKEEAIKCAKNNTADINDGGSYNYIVIIKVPFNYCYAEFMAVEDIEILKYNKETKLYNIVTSDTDEEIFYIKNKYKIVDRNNEESINNTKILIAKNKSISNCYYELICESNNNNKLEEIFKKYIYLNKLPHHQETDFINSIINLCKDNNIDEEPIKSNLKMAIAYI